ncbi:MAG: LapA family protein [Candidatus Puniceispirillaceae bacterium]|nr:hypothetical protein [Alphaproteobacteria bacterium]|tara:strand:+ start:336 stop:662 length:327 start_codon:yes stop_codon:yes gene_type:complete
MMRFISRLGWLFFLIITIVFLAGFVTHNHTQIALQFWPAQATAEGEVWVFVLGAFGLGMVIGAMIFWLHGLRLKARLWSSTRQIAELNARIEASAQSDDDNSLPERYG